MPVIYVAFVAGGADVPRKWLLQNDNSEPAAAGRLTGR